MKKVSEKLEPCADIVNRQPKVLLIGYGWVGQFCGKYFTDADIYTRKGFKKKKHNRWDLGIISVPTPMNPNTGQCDTSILEKCVKKFKDKINYFMIKSTVEIGTMDELKNKYQVKICMSPEYIGETLGHPMTEPKRDIFLIIGGEENTVRKVAEFWRVVLNANAKIFLCSAVEAEIIKYAENYWIARRVDYWNDVYDICQTWMANFDRVREGLVLDPRLNRTHSFVYPKNRGWSGKCLPKDMNALAYSMRKMGKPLKTLEHLIEKNASYWRKGYKDKNKLKPDKPRWRKRNEK